MKVNYSIKSKNIFTEILTKYPTAKSSQILTVQQPESKLQIEPDHLSYSTPMRSLNLIEAVQALSIIH